ncbi:Hypothetical predicted protein [Marmota monax]|uniref:Leucine-rich repeat-containing protein 29 n=1 Tax=Marmota monax TaxID=9995 RepID=A0A5E4AGN5_MARMO|nr:hypothetical protein GHT09_006094 [Marmota monax]VTJ56408.1 Hypothetical predicted protein [Marmota monax]
MAQRVRQALSGLRELKLACLRNLSDLSFNQLSSCVPSLERLSLAYCHLNFELSPAQGSINPQDDSPFQLSFHNLLRFVKERAGKLRALDLSGTGLPPEALHSLGQMAILCRQQPGLTSLDLSGCSELTDGALLAVSRGLQHLQHLSLGKLQRLTDAGCTALGGLRELQSLDMAECCLVSGRELAQALGSVSGAPPPLTSLRLAYCSSLKDASVLSLIPALGPSLRVLDLSSCMALSNRTLQAICTYHTHLSVLRLAWCKELRDWGLLGLEESSEKPALCPQLCPELEYQASGPEDASPKPQSSSLLILQALQELDLTACSKLTDASLAKVTAIPPAEAVVTEPIASTHRHGLGGSGQRLPQLGTLGAESLQPHQRRGLGPGSRVLAKAAARQPVQLQSTHRAVSVYYDAEQMEPGAVAGLGSHAASSTHLVVSPQNSGYH